MRAAPAGLLVLLMLGLKGELSNAAEIVPNIYVGETITTGTSEEHRPAALAKCFIDVLIKASGDPRLATNGSAAAMAEHAATFVKSLRYRDRLEGRPIHDEQGTRDRPHDLTVEFEPSQIDGALQSLGSRPWTAERPKIAMVVFVRFGEASYILTQSEPRGENQREALQAASDRIGVPVALPRLTGIASNNAPIDPTATLTFKEAEELASTLGVDRVVTGSMIFSDEAQGWIAKWRLHEPAGTAQWQVTGVNYDEAFRVALRGAAQILSGNGRPL